MLRHENVFPVSQDLQKRSNSTRMPRVRSFVLTGLMATLGVFSGGNTALAINNGQNDETNMFSNVGTIVLDFGVGDAFQACTGTLIDDRAILTAAHCVIGVHDQIASGAITEDDVYFSFDANDPMNNVASWIPVVGTSSHPDYVGIPAFYDVGLLFLGADAPAGLEPAELAPSGYLDELVANGTISKRDRTEFTVVGYGLERSFPQRAFDDPGGIRRRYATGTFQNLEPQFLHLNQVQSVGQDNGGTCYGDSGGPGFFDNGDSLILTSVTSWGDWECVATDKRQRIDLPSVQSYIDGALFAAAGVGSSVAAVPEPHGSMLALVCFISISLLRRRFPS